LEFLGLKKEIGRFQTRNSGLLCSLLQSNMLQASTLQFLADLKENNHKDWFQENRKAYETAKTDFLNFMDGVLSELSKADPTLKGIAAKETIFRLRHFKRRKKVAIGWLLCSFRA
jgi:uncharacterized protein (DUF2461 family)